MASSSSSRTTARTERTRPLEALAATLLLGVHASLALWGATSTSVTYDESFHVPAGIVLVTTGDAGLSPVNPPLVKGLFGVAALAAGAKPLDRAVLATRDPRAANESFMRANAARYRHIYLAARLVSLALSIALALVLWRAARARFGAAGGLLSLGLWAVAPEALAHAGFATLDIATSLLWLAVIRVGARFVRLGSARDGLQLTLLCAAFAVTRFTAPLAPLVVAALWAVERLRGRAAPLSRVAWIALALPVAMVVALGLAYGGHISLRPVVQWDFASQRFQTMAHALPWLRLPLPDDVLRGLDRQAFDAEPGHLSTFALGRITTDTVWWYFPIAIALKWPLGLLAAIAGALALLITRRRLDQPELAIGGLVYLAPAMFFGNLDAGVRYVLPLLPLACIGAGALAAPEAPRAWRALGLASLAGAGLETATTGPWWLSHFKPLAGPPAARERLLNDSNVDWGQGLVDLRRELERRGIPRVHLSYHGTADPHLYGIDFVPYLTGAPGPESDWLAVSSYFYVGLPQTVRLRDGPSPQLMRFDFSSLPPSRAAARPGDCMWLFKVR